MKILFASATDSGILRVRSELITELLRLGHEVVVATPQDKDYIKLEAMGCKFTPVTIEGHGTNPVADLVLYKQYKKILKNEKPNMVLLFTTKANVYCGIACRKLGIPVVMNITGMGTALSEKGLVQSVLIRLYKKACNGNNIKKIFFQNDDSMEFFKARSIGNPEIYERIPGSGVNLEKFKVQPFPQSDTVDFLFIGRVLKQKGIDQYIEAAKIIRKDNPKAVFHVLGECSDDYREILKKESEKGTIVYHGKVNDIPYYQNLSQCTIQPSYYPEGMSNVILEAAACGRPVITTEHPGCREGVVEGKTGFLVPIRDVDALVAAINRVLSMSRSERIEMGLRGRTKMMQEFDRRYVTKAYIDLLKAEELYEQEI